MMGCRVLSRVFSAVSSDQRLGMTAAAVQTINDVGVMSGTILTSHDPTF